MANVIGGFHEYGLMFASRQETRIALVHLP